MEPTSQQLERIKSIEFEMLKSFISVCESLHLTYYVLGGTLLGAVRHQGFIPWDDDIDIGMPREDYERFLKEGQAYLPEYYFIQSMDTEPEYIATFAKIRDSRTTFIEASVASFRINHGVYIDIFPLDPYPDRCHGWFDFKNNFLKLRIEAAYKGLKASLSTKIKRVVAFMLLPSLEKAVARRERLYRSVPHGNRMVNYGGAWGSKEIVPTSWFGAGKTLTFEGLKVNAPSEYELWLTQIYGDYMQLPPPEKRIPHHFVKMIDLDRPYTDYVNRD